MSKSPERNTTLVFVYGSLMSAMLNHDFLKNTRFIGEAETSPRYDMRNIFDFPAVLEGGHSVIYGEVYAVNSNVMKKLDDLESTPILYQRRLVETSLGACNIYLGNQMSGVDWFGYEQIPSGSWKEFLKTRPELMPEFKTDDAKKIQKNKTKKF